MKINRISPRRQLVQIFLLAVLFLIPFLRIGEIPFLQLNIGLRTLFFAGMALRVDELFLVLLLFIVVMLLFFLITTILGRIWCGWLCPQTVVNDLVEMVSRWLAEPVKHPYAGLAATHLVAAIVSLLLAIAMLGWFMSPADVVRVISHPHDNLISFSMTVTIAFFLYADMVVIKREFCRSYCPYGRFQTVLMDEGTLNLGFLQDSKDRCIDCKSCIRACPMGIDIRQGFQIECINCGRCIDACRDVMERINYGNGLFAYRFGGMASGRPRLGQKTVILFLAFTIASLTLYWNLQNRSGSTFSVQRSATADSRQLPDGAFIRPWRTIIGNRGQLPALFTLTIAPLTGTSVTLLGPVTNISIAPNQNRPVDFTLRIFSPSGALPAQIELRLFKNGVLAETQKITP